MDPEGDEDVRARIAGLHAKVRARLTLHDSGSGYRSGQRSRTLEIELDAGPTYAGQFLGVAWLMLSVVLGFGATKLLGTPTHGRAAIGSLAVMSLVAGVVGLGPVGYLLWRPRRGRALVLSEQELTVRGTALRLVWGGDLVLPTADLDRLELRAADRYGNQNLVAHLRDDRQVIVLHDLAAGDLPERTLALLDAFRAHVRR